MSRIIQAVDAIFDEAWGDITMGEKEALDRLRDYLNEGRVER